MMVFERLPFYFNIQKLQGFLFDTVFPIGDAICPVHPGFGGWSITSDTGHWQDGWKKSKQSARLPEEFNKPTELYKGYMAEVIDTIKEKGLNPTKVRISGMPPQSESTIHRDYPAEYFRARLHIPLLTNKLCSHILYSSNLKEKVEYHMPATGNAVMFYANLKHQYKNRSNEMRYHLIMDVIDKSGITENFKCIMH
jgi:hypothetical protein